MSDINLENKIMYDMLWQKHINESGKMPRESAITELIRIAIENRDYKIYLGQGCEYGSTNRIKRYDVVVWFCNYQ